jgi:hypothetical protein
MQHAMRSDATTCDNLRQANQLLSDICGWPAIVQNNMTQVFFATPGHRFSEFPKR